jgi:hypothetical protein
MHGWRSYMWRHNRTRYSSKIAVDVSHFCVWEMIASSNRPGIIFEDDIRLTGPNWSRDLLTVLNELPEVCSVLQLQQGCAVCCSCSGGASVQLQQQAADLNQTSRPHAPEVARVHLARTLFECK